MHLKSFLSLWKIISKNFKMNSLNIYFFKSCMFLAKNMSFCRKFANCFVIIILDEIICEFCINSGQVQKKNLSYILCSKFSSLKNLKMIKNTLNVWLKSCILSNFFNVLAKTSTLFKKFVMTFNTPNKCTFFNLLWIPKNPINIFMYTSKILLFPHFFQFEQSRTLENF